MTTPTNINPDLYPDLPQPALDLAVNLIEQFKKDLRKAADEALQEAMGKLYVEIMPHIQSDSWCNFRTSILMALKGYGSQHIREMYDFKGVRRKILEEYRDELIEDLNKDLLEEIKRLKDHIRHISKFR